jgi:HD-GYP domain-containing protein (c-di-GMP phosphodiesterase class II)
MSEAFGFLTSLAQALAQMSLYGEGHPARARAAEMSFRRLRDLLAVDPRPVFTFLGDEVIHADRAVRDLDEWDWARKLSNAGVQRIEFQRSVSDAEYHAFLESVLERLAAIHGETSAPGAAGPIRFGGVGIRGSREVTGPEIGPLDQLVDMPSIIDLSEEADAVQWMHEEVLDERVLPLAEAEAVVASLCTAMHSASNAIVPLLRLKEFDQYTTTHSINVSVLAMSLAEHLGLSPREVRTYGMTGLLHDLGKVHVPLDILRKPGRLTPREFSLLRRHPVDGAKLILEADGRLELCAVVAFEHHIMIDGGGYPQRQRRCDCHSASLLVHVCDVFDALRTHRPYRVAWDEGAIVTYLRERCGKEFDPDVTNAFLEMVGRRVVSGAHAIAIDGEPAAA